MASVPPPTVGLSGLPTVPIEVQKRIIQHALAVPSGAPFPLTADTPYSIAWDQYAGQIGREAKTRRAVQRVQAARTALNLMLVSKGWRRIAERCLYTDPHIDPDNLYQFISALQIGDRKWSSIHLHPDSTPGRYVEALDLSRLAITPDGPQSGDISRALDEMFNFLPNLRRITMPPAEIPSGEWAPGCAWTLHNVRHLDGLWVADEEQYNPFYTDRKDVYQFLQKASHLESLSLFGLKHSRPLRSGDLTDFEPDAAWKPLQLARLHSLSLRGLGGMQVIRPLLHAQLPRLCRLYLASGDGDDLHLMHVIQVRHGAGLHSLTIAQDQSWPQQSILLTIDTLSLHPILTHLSYLPTNLTRLAQILLFAPHNHPLQAVTLSKRALFGVSNVVSLSQNLQAPNNGLDKRIREFTARVDPTSDPLIQSLDDGTESAIGVILHILRTRRHLPDIRFLTIDGYHWASPHLGQRALESGDSGRMRALATQLGAVGIEVRDSLGEPMPEAQDPGACAPLSKQVGPMLRSPELGRKRLRLRPASSPEQIKADELEDDGA